MTQTSVNSSLLKTKFHEVPFSIHELEHVGIKVDLCPLNPTMCPFMETLV